MKHANVLHKRAECWFFNYYTSVAANQCSMHRTEKASFSMLPLQEFACQQVTVLQRLACTHTVER